MTDMEPFVGGIEVCEDFSYDQNISELDLREISCITCKNWNGEKCCLMDKDINNYDK